MGRKPTDAFIDLYLGVSGPLFDAQDVGRAHAAMSRSVDETMTVADFTHHLDFAQTQFNHRVTELSRAARVVSDIPEFHFFYSNAGTYDAQAVSDLDKPLVRMDASLYSFWFVLCCLVVWVEFGTDDHFERLELRRALWNTIDSFCTNRCLPRDDIPLFDAWFGRDEHLSTVAVSLANTIAYFVILHEMMHLGAEPDLTGDALEFEMGRRAAKALVLTRATPGLSWANVPIGCMAAPVLFFEIQRLIWMYRGATAQTNPGHPPPIQRRKRLEGYVCCDLTEDRDMYLALRHATGWIAVGRRTLL